MGECLFEANGPDNDNKPTGKSDNGTDTGNEIELNHQTKLTGYHKADERGKWIEENISRTDRDTENTDKQPPNRWAQITSEDEGKWRTVLHSYIRHQVARISSALSWDGEKNLTTDPRHHGKNEHPRIVKSEIDDPPPLTNEDGDWEDEEFREQSRRIKPPKTLEQQACHENSSISEMEERGGIIATESFPSTYKCKAYWDISSREPTQRQQIIAENNYIDIKEIENRIYAELEGQVVESILNMKDEWPWLDATSPSTYEDDASSMETLEESIHDIEMNENKTPLLPKDYKYRPIDSFFKRAEVVSNRRGSIESGNERKTENMSKDKLNKIKEKETMATEIALVIIRKCKQQLLTAWKWKIECSIRYGYEHNIAQLLRKRESKVQRTGNAMEMQVLLRRCSYPKRDVIRWFIRRGYRVLSSEEPCSLKTNIVQESLRSLCY